MNKEKPKNCFVIMPFSVRDEDLHKYGGDGQHWSEVYHGLIAPAVTKTGLNCYRDNDDSTSRFITESIWRKLEDADVVLCDLSATNPNVFLELGWALRSDRRFVLIKDDLTEFQFDLNQYFTFTYSHRLQPSNLARNIDGLCQTLTETLSDKRRKYSIVTRLGIELTAIQASESGNIETRLLQEIRDDVRSLRHQPVVDPEIRRYRSLNVDRQVDKPPPPHISATDWESLQTELVGTQWTNTRSGDVLLFIDDTSCFVRMPRVAKWKRLRYECGESFPAILFKWSDIGQRFSDFQAVFSDDFSSFLENQRTLWTIA